jgi:hypothetical protein
MMRRTALSAAARVVAVLLLGAGAPSCGQAILSAPTGSTLQIFVNPPFIAANGDTAVVSVLATEPAGTPVPDGTVIQFFTSIGRIDEQAKTNDGVARVNLISDARSGTATVTAVSGPVNVKLENFVIGAPRVSSVRTIALDPVIDTRLGRSIAFIKATVLDSNGNTIPGIFVRFTVSQNPATDHILGPRDVATDNSGEATSRVQTNRTTPGTIIVKVEVLAPMTGTIPDIVIQVL